MHNFTNMDRITMNKKALISLLLLVPMPSLAVFVGMIWYPNTGFGQAFFMFGKLWVVLLPVLWLILVEKTPLKFSKPSRDGLLLALLSGILIAAIIFLSYWFIGRSYVDPQALKNMAAEVGLDKPVVYLAMAVYWTTVNSVLEEYVWRWFVTRQFRRLLSPLWAIIASAIGFTLHHIVAMQLYFSLPIVALAAAGVFVGGVIWSWMYLRYQSIWPGYLSHAFADFAIFAIGYSLIFR